MANLEDRARAFEWKFAHDEEIEFNATARLHRLTGDWVSDLCKLSPEEKTAYTVGLIHAAVKDMSREELVQSALQKVVADAVGTVDEEAVRSKIDEFERRAHDEMINGV